MIRVLLASLALAAALQQPASAARPAPRGAWGAVAYSSTTGAYGFAVDQASRRTAEMQAFRQCGADCDVLKTFRNACGAIAEAEKHYAWDTGASREIAEMKARKKCGTDTCRISVWACTGGK
jgi:uncharacterized protein DUF4189